MKFPILVKDITNLLVLIKEIDEAVVLVDKQIQNLGERHGWNDELRAWREKSLVAAQTIVALGHRIRTTVIVVPDGNGTCDCEKHKEEA